MKMEYKWIKPEDADIPFGEVCVAIRKDFAFPFFVYKNSVNFTFFPVAPDGIDEDAQPDYVLELPPVPMGIGRLKDEAD